MKRLLISVVATVAALIGAAAFVGISSGGANATVTTHVTNWNGVRGADNLPCEGGTLLWIWTGNTSTAATLTLNGVNYEGDQRGNGAFHFMTPGDDVATDSTAFVTYTGPVSRNGVVTISHCTGGGETTPPPTSPVPSS